MKYGVITVDQMADLATILKMFPAFTCSCLYNSERIIYSKKTEETETWNKSCFLET